MKLITRYELASKPKGELYMLRRKVTDILTHSAPGSAARRNALASLENIEAELAHRPDGP